MFSELAPESDENHATSEKVFTCGHAGLYVGRVLKSDNECTFWSAVEILISFDRIVTCDNVTMGDKCDLM